MLAQLADTIGARWRAEGTARVLLRTPEQERSDQEASLRLRAEYVERVLEHARRDLDVPFDATFAENLGRQWNLMSSRYRASSLEGRLDEDAYHAMERLKNQTPVRRLLIRTLLGLGPETIARLGPDERLVLTMRPTARQVSLPRTAGDALEEYIREEGTWASTVERLGLRSEDPAGGMMIDDPFARTTSLSRVPESLVVVVSGPRGWMSLRAQVFVGANFRLLGDFLPPMTMRYPMNLDPTISEEGRDIPLSETSRELLRGMRSVTQGTPVDPPLSEQLRALLRDPRRHEPTNLILGDVLRDWGTAHERPVIAHLADPILLHGIHLAHRMGPRYPQFLELLAAAGAEIDEAGDWLAFRLVDRARLLRETWNRDLAHEYVDALERGYLTFDESATLAYRTASRTESVFPLLGTLVHDLLLIGSEEQSPILRFFGSLNATQRTALRAGHPLTAMMLNPEQRRALEQVVYSDFIRNRRSRPLPDNLAEEVRRHLEEMEWEESWSSTHEPTTELPHGLPNDLRITLAERVVTHVYAYPNERSRLRYSFAGNPDQVGQMWEWQVRAGSAPPVGFRLAERRVTRLTLTYPREEIAQVFILSHTTMPRQQPLLTFEQLPAEVREGITSGRRSIDD